MSSTTAPAESAIPAIRPLVRPNLLLATFVITAIVGLADPLLTKSTLDLTNNDGTLIFGLLPVSWLLAIGLYLAAMIAPIKIGRAEARGEKSWVVQIAWAGLGLSLFALRWFEDVVLTGGDWDEFNWITHLPLACVIIFLYIMTGYGFRYVAKEYVRTPWHLVQPILKRASKFSQTAINAVALALHAQYAFDANRIQASLWTAEYDSHLTRVRNAEAEVKDVLRARLAAHLASPAESSLMLEEHRGTNANEEPVSTTDTGTDNTTDTTNNNTDNTTA